MRCARCGLPQRRLSRDKRTGTPWRWLSLGRRRSTRACDARAPRRDGCGRSMRYGRPLHQREASPFAARPWCDVPGAASNAQTGFRVANARRAPLRWLSLGMRRSTRACDARAPRRAGCGRFMRHGRPLRQRRPPLRCKTVLRRVCCGLQHTAGFRVTHARARHHCAGYLSGGGAARALATRARRAAMVVVGPCATEAHCASETALSFGARPCCDVLAAASNDRRRSRVTHAIAPPLRCSLGRRRSTRACDARAPRRAGCGRSMPYGSPLRQRDGPLSSVHGRAPTCLPRPPTQQTAFACAHTRARHHCAGCLSGGGAARALATRARPAALVVIGPCPTEAHCASETALSFGARPCCDVPAAASNEQPAFACAHTRARHRAALSQEEAQHARLRRARAAPRWLWSVHALRKATAPARRPSPSVHGRAPTCQPRPPTSSRRSRGAHASAPPLALSQEEAQHARLRRARAAPRWLWSVHALRKPTAPARRPSPSVHGRAPTCQPRPPTSSRRSRGTRERATALLSLRRRRSTRACDVRAPRRAGCGRSMPYGSPLHQRDGPLRRCTAVLRCASRGLQRADRASRVRTRERATARSLSGGGAARALATCARRAALVVSVHALRKPTAPARRPSSSVHGRAPTCQPRPPTSRRRSRVRTRDRATTRSLSGGGAARALATCARPAALVVVGPCSTKAHCASETALSVGARPCSDVPAAASNEQTEFACAHTRSRHRTLSLRRRRSTRACDVRAPRRAGCVGPCPTKAHCASETALSVGARPCSDMPAAASNEQTAFACAHTRSRHRTPPSGGGAARALATCARRAALVVPVHALRKPTAPARRPSPSVHGRAPTCQPRPPTSRRSSRVRTHDRATTRSLSGGGAARALATCARRAALVVSVHALRKPTVPARRPSPSVHGRAPTCQPRPPTSRRSSRVRTRDRATTRSPSGGGAARALATCARRAALVVSVHTLRKPTAPARRPSPSVHGRAPACQPRPPTSSRSSRVRTRDRATTRSPSGGGAARALATCARRAALVGSVHALWKPTAPARRPSSSVHGRAPACQPRPPTSRRSSRVRTRDRATTRSPSGGGAARALATCARRAALVESVHALRKPTAPARRPSPSVHGRAPTCQPRPPTSRRSSRVRTRDRATTRSPSGGGAARALATCARRAALVVPVHTLRKPTVPARRPSPSVHGRAPTCQPRPPTSRRSSRVRTRDRATTRSPSGGGAARALATCARPAALVGSVHALWKPTAPARRPSPSVHGRAPACQPRPPTSRRSSRVRTRDRATTRSPSGGGAARALATCARRAALVGVGPCPTEAHCASETALSVGARPCSDMLAAASNEQTEFACAHTRSRHRTLSLRRRRSTRACDVRAPRRAGCVGPCPTEAHCASETALSVGARPCSDMPAAASNEQTEFACAHTRSRHHTPLPQEEAQHARLRRARAPPRWLWSVHALRKPTAPARRPSPSVHGRAPTCQPRPPTSRRSSRVRTHDRATTRSPSGGGAARALATCARRAALVVSVHALRKPTVPARRPSSSVHGRAPTCQPRPPTSRRSSRVRTRDRATTRSPSGGGAARALATCARLAALVGVGPCSMEAHCASETALSVGARPCSGMPAAASNEQTEFACAHTRSRHRTLSLGRRRSTRACDVRALRRAGCGRSMSYGSPLRQRDGPLRRCTAVLRRASRGLQRADGVRVCAHAIAPPRALSPGGGAARALATCARRAALVGSVHALRKPTAPARRPSPSVHGRAPTCQPRPPTSSRRSRVRTRDRATTRSLSGGGAARALATCARRAALVRVGPCSMEAHCASETALSVGARPCSDVPAAASNEQTAFACAHTRSRHHALSLGRRRSTRACDVRALRRAGWSRSMLLRKPTAPARRPSPSVHGRAPTCQPRPPTSSRRSRVRTRERATARSLSGGGAARALATRARRTAMGVAGPRATE